MNARMRYAAAIALFMLAAVLHGCGGGVSEPEVTLVDKTSSLTRHRISGNVYEIISVGHAAGRAAGDADSQAATQSVIMRAATQSVTLEPAPGGEAATSAQRFLQIPQSSSTQIVVPKPNITVTCGGKSAQTDSDGNYVIEGYETYIHHESGTQKVVCEIEYDTFHIILGNRRDTGPFNALADFEIFPDSYRYVTITSNIPSGNLHINGATTTGQTAFPTEIRIVDDHDYELLVSAENHETPDAQTVEACGINGCGSVNADFTLKPQVSSITISASGGDNIVGAGETEQLIAACSYRTGANGDCTGDVSWTSSDTTVATVSSAGLLTMLKSGSVNITASRAQSGVTSAPYGITGGALAESACDGVSGVCLDLVGASIAPGGGAAVSAVVSSAPAGGIIAGELKLTWGQGVTLTSATAANGVTIWSQNTDASNRTFAAVYTSSGALASGSSIMTLNFTADASLARPASVNWVSSSDEYTDITDALFQAWNYGTFTLRGALLDLGL